MVVQEESAANLSTVTMTPRGEQPAVREERRKVTLLSFFFWLEFVLLNANFMQLLAVDLLRILI